MRVVEDVKALGVAHERIQSYVRRKAYKFGENLVFKSMDTNHNFFQYH